MPIVEGGTLSKNARHNKARRRGSTAPAAILGR